MRERLKEVLKAFSVTLTIDESLELERGIVITMENGNYPDYYIRIVDNKSE